MNSPSDFPAASAMNDSIAAVRPKGPAAVQSTSQRTWHAAAGAGAAARWGQPWPSCCCCRQASGQQQDSNARHAWAPPSCPCHVPTWQPPATVVKVKVACVANLAPPGMSGTGWLTSWMLPSGRLLFRCVSTTFITSLPTRRRMKAGASTGVQKATRRSSPRHSPTSTSAGVRLQAAAACSGVSSKNAAAEMVCLAARRGYRSRLRRCCGAHLDRC